jgi:hypothetical protein
VTESEIEELIALISQGNKSIDREIAGFISTLQLLMQRNILRELSDIGDRRSIREAGILRLLGGLESLALTDNVIEHIQTIEDIFDVQSAISNRAYRLANKKSAPMDLSRKTEINLAVFVSSRKQNVEIMARAYANEVRQGLADSIISGNPISDFELASVPAERIFSTLNNDLKTASAVYQRIVALEQGRLAKNKSVLYAGPKDARNRPFCAERVNKIYPLQVVYTWDNGQGLPADLYCGGFGCRHVLVPVGK